LAERAFTVALASRSASSRCVETLITFLLSRFGVRARPISVELPSDIKEREAFEANSEQSGVPHSESYGRLMAIGARVVKKFDYLQGL
jgi:hypothetical protein